MNRLVTPAELLQIFEREGTTNELEKRCVYDVSKTRPGSARDKISSAYAICRASFQKSGREKKGTATLTKKGKGVAAAKARSGDHSKKVAGFEKLVKAARKKS